MSQTTNLDVKHAFPIPEKWNDSGMTLRDYFAAQALVGILSNPNSFEIKNHDQMSDAFEETQGDLITETCYEFADEMIIARDRKTKL